jgi:hypothetical protein
MKRRYGALISFAVVMPTIAFAGIAEDNVAYSAHMADATSVGYNCAKAAPMTISDGSMSVDWARLAMQVAAGAAASPATTTSGNIVPPRQALKCDSSRMVQNP